MNSIFSESEIKPNSRDVTTRSGRPIGDKLNAITVGPRGPILLQDFQLIEELAHFDRERIPERVVHAKGAGAFGYFVVTSDEITKYCKADLFNKLGKRTPIAVRFSTVSGESGSADTVRDIRGFAVKFYTKQGIWDIVGNNTPVFFIRDPSLFPSLIHSQKRNPKTHLKDPDIFWDFISLCPEATHQMTILYGDRGIPYGYRHMNGYGGHTFVLVNEKDEFVFCKFHYKTDQGIKTMTSEEGLKFAGSDPDFGIRDLFDAIDKEDFPSWTFYIQVMTKEEAKAWKYNPFDLTKVWPHSEFPLIEVGKLVLDRNPKNYFAEVEQMAFSPANLIPGIEPSPDKMLQGRLFAYSDTHRYRLGVNHQSIPVNRPICPVNTLTQRNGYGCFDNNHGDLPNYFPNSFSNINIDKKNKEHRFAFDISEAFVDRHKYESEDHFSQVTDFWEFVLDADERLRVTRNIADHLKDANEKIQQRLISNLEKVHKDFASNVKLELQNHKK